jgi:hypothetical protein
MKGQNLLKYLPFCLMDNGIVASTNSLEPNLQKQFRLFASTDLQLRIKQFYVPPARIKQFIVD